MSGRGEREGLLREGYTYTSLTGRLLSLSAGSFRAGWWLGLLLAASLVGMMLVSIAWLLLNGVGVWGIDIPTAWGFAITNFVWWIGIGHAGTLISAILLLFRQKWRNSINRFAEAMTLFAIMMAGLFPLLHLGRIQRFYYLFPYPNQLDMWPQWRSPLVWDVVAVLTYGIVSLVFWYLGLLPDLASLRDFARRPAVRRLAGFLSLGWRGSVRQWDRYNSLYLLLAGLATPLVVSVHSIVSLDFAVTLVPGWHSTVFPPYFVAGAIFSGMAMVLTITVPLRRAFRLHDVITLRHFDAMAKITLATGLMVGYGYLAELFTEWYSGEHAELTRLHHRFAGVHAPLFYTMIVCNVLIPQLLWIPRMRRNPLGLFALSIVINIGMWVERYDIVVSSLSQNSHLPATRGPFSGTVWDWTLLIGSLGTFAFLFLLFVRLVPMISGHEMRELLHERGRMGQERERGGLPSLSRPSPDVLLARFREPEGLREAAKALRQKGIERLDAYTPMPVEGLREAMGLRRTRLPWAVAAGALLGAGGAYWLQWYAAVVSFPWNIGGRPLHSWPSFLPLTFEVGVLCGSLTGLVVFCLANGFPKPYSPLSRAAGFARASADRFFLALPSGRSAAERENRQRMLLALGAERVQEVAS